MEKKENIVYNINYKTKEFCKRLNIKQKNEKLIMQKKNEKGITLIALVITIIVLIILAMVTIAMLTGPNGLLNKAVEARIANDKAEIQDRAETEVLGSIGKNGKIDWDELRGNLASNFDMDEGDIANKGAEASDGFKFTVEKNNRNYYVDINERGKVTVKYEGESTSGGSETLEEPKVDLGAYKEGSWTNQEITITLKSNDADITYQYKDSDTESDWKNCEGNKLTINENQEKTYKFRTKANNKEVFSKETKGYSIKFDNTPPKITVEQTNTTTSEISVRVKSQDDESSMKEQIKYTYYIRETKSGEENEYIQEGNPNTTEDTYTFTNLDVGKSYDIKVEVDGNNAGLTGIGLLTTTTEASCFVAGTKVLTENGMKNIEDIEVGEKVWTLNVDNNSRELKEVTNLYRGVSTEIYDITVNNKVIKATPRHQFYILDKGWTRAYNLKEGDELTGVDIGTLKIEKIVYHNNLDPVPVYNMTVEGNHNYLITEFNILVHNGAVSSGRVT